jgi:hypothetical protein
MPLAITGSLAFLSLLLGIVPAVLVQIIRGTAQLVARL